jgi:lysozyme family protein
MADTFDACLAQTLRHEGGYSDDPHDPGGPTMRGITHRVYDAWRDAHGEPRRDVRAITADEVARIYRSQYWEAVSGDALPPGIDLAVFDFSVNSGPARAIKALQRAIGVAADGHIGAVTLTAAHAADPVDTITRIMDERLVFLRQLRHFWRFGRGWTRRVEDVRECALDMVHTGGETRGSSRADAATHPLGLSLMVAAKAPEPAGDATAPNASAKAVVAAAPETMAQSKTAWASLAGALGGIALLLQQINMIGRELMQAATTARGLRLDAGAVASNPWLWVGLIPVWACLFIWLERRRKIREGA